MALNFTLTAYITNTTGKLLDFQAQPAIHGNNPVASEYSLANNASSVVTATPVNSVSDSPQGSFLWKLPDSAGQFEFTYDLHDSPMSITASSVPNGYAVPTCSIDADGNANISMIASSSRPVVMPQISTIVFLMLENRSFDNVLGWMETSGNTTFYPSNSPTFVDGLANYKCQGALCPTDGTTGANPCRVPAFDPYEPMEHVQVQMYASATGTMPTGYFWADTPPMTGFAWDYDSGAHCTLGEVMGAYDAEQLPVLYGLAQNYAVSDRWFASVPSQTDPNRAFSVCGTSLGCEDNSDIDSNTFAQTRTIFNVLGEAGKSWGLYWQMDNPLGTGEPGTWLPYTSYYFPMMNQAPGGGVYPWTNFTAALQAGTLPNFCYVEPYWGGGGGIDCETWAGMQGNDYHPPAWVGPAENSLNTVFQSIVASPQWKNNEMLLVITFDEHGGTFDHVAPTPCVPPDDNVGRTGFAFDRLGVRVPTMLISPYIAGPTVFRAPSGSQYDFDHASFLATFCLWAGVEPADAGLGQRVAVAPTFDGVLSATPSGISPPAFSVPPGYATQGGGVGKYGILDDVMAGSTKPMDVHEFRKLLDDSQDADDFMERFKKLRGQGAL